MAKYVAWNSLLSTISHLNLKDFYEKVSDNLTFENNIINASEMHHSGVYYGRDEYDETPFVNLELLKDNNHNTFVVQFNYKQSSYKFAALPKNNDYGIHFLIENFNPAEYKWSDEYIMPELYLNYLNKSDSYFIGNAGFITWIKYLISVNNLSYDELIQTFDKCSIEGDHNHNVQVFQQSMHANKLSKSRKVILAQFNPINKPYLKNAILSYLDNFETYEDTDNVCLFYFPMIVKQLDALTSANVLNIFGHYRNEIQDNLIRYGRFDMDMTSDTLYHNITALFNEIIDYCIQQLKINVEKMNGNGNKAVTISTLKLLDTVTADTEQINPNLVINLAPFDYKKKEN